MAVSMFQRWIRKTISSAVCVCVRKLVFMHLQGGDARVKLEATYHGRETAKLAWSSMDYLDFERAIAPARSLEISLQQSQPEILRDLRNCPPWVANDTLYVWVAVGSNLTYESRPEPDFGFLMIRAVP